MKKLIAFCSAFPKGEGFRIPVIKNEESLQMVEQKVGNHLDSIINQCRIAAADTTLSKGKLTEIIDETKRVISGFRNYESILSTNKREFDSKVQLVRDMVSLLLEKGVA